MFYLDAVETSLDQRLQPISSPAIAGVSPDRERAGFVREANRILDRKACLRYESGASRAKVSHESISKIVDDAPRYQRSRHVRSADRAAVCLNQNFVEGYLDAKRVQFLDNFLRPRESQGPQLAEPLLECVQLRHMQRQHMNFVVVEEGAQLDARYHPHPKTLTG